jgi:hypothetical protein
MSEKDLKEINWTAVFIGFSVDWVFSLLVGLVILGAMLAVEGTNLETEGTLPPELDLAIQTVGIVGAIVGGSVAGYISLRRGTLHGVLASLIGLPVSFCMYGAALEVGDLGFIVLNVIGAGYGGKFGQRWRARRKRDND